MCIVVFMLGFTLFSPTYAGFKNTGQFYLTPNLTQADMTTLREGGIVGDKYATLIVRFMYQGKEHTAMVTVTAKDATHGLFFGDRPLDDPGYSTFNLRGSVGVDKNNLNDRLDVTRVEQRLKYLGFSAFNYPTTSGFYTAGNPRIPQELTVDGKFGNEERSAVQAFYAITHLKDTPQTTPSPSADFNWGIEDVGAGGTTISVNGDNINWLNAYNAPHWMNIYDSFGIPHNAVKDHLSSSVASNTVFKDNTSSQFEIYGTSWMRDLLEALREQSATLSAAGLSTGVVQLNGMTDPGYGATKVNQQGATVPIHYTANHSIGMGLDLGLGQWIQGRNQNIEDAPGVDPDGAGPIVGNNPVLNLSTVPGSDWSVARAKAMAELLPGPQSSGVTPNNQQQALRDFFALYALTQKDSIASNGTWEELRIKNGTTTDQQDQIRAALFGDGTQAGGLITNVLVGDASKNKYSNIQAVLAALNIDRRNASGHQDHFHITLQTPNRVALPNNLVTEQTIPQSTQVVVDPILDTAAQSLLNQLQPQLGFDFSQEVIMFPLDVPPEMPVQYAPVVIAQTVPLTQRVVSANRTIGVCQIVGSTEPEGSAQNVFSPGLSAYDYLRKTENEQVGLIRSAILLQGPKHGMLKDGGNGYWKYRPTDGYLGFDHATWLVEVGDFKVKVVYSIHVVEGGAPSGDEGGYDPYEDKKYCPNGDTWKISLSDPGAVSFLAGFVSPAALLNYQLKQIDISLNFANLANGAVGETTGSKITLDDDGGDYGWFIDSTPADNDEFLSTSNPNEFIAKPGSAAAGKMDLLTVLLHEYGHALGLDHSADMHDFMAEELQPGVRRTVSDADMAKLWSLLSEPMLVDASAGASTSSATGTGEGSDPSLPFDPLSPLGLSFFFGFVRRRVDTSSAGQGIVLPPLASNDPNAVTINPSSVVTVNDTPQHELATHTDVFNGDFGIADSSNSQFGWNTHGNVSMTGGAAELLESDRTLSGFSQAFVVPADVKALRFTIEAAQFTANGATPPDAFEVALLNSVTGLPVVGTVSLTHSDALFNLQSNGTLSVASGVTVNGLPNSTSGLLSLTSPVTVTVDVSNVPAGTSLKLYFDLLGLGAKGSRVVIDDVKLLTSLNTAPVAVNDSATAAGVTPVQIVVLANDTDAENDPLTPSLVSNAAHGNVVLNGDGTFSYTANAGFSGADSFTYRVSDGVAVSNVATVNIVVSNGNSAPVAVNDTVTTAEDAVTNIEVRSNDTDANDALSVALVSGAAHGTVNNKPTNPRPGTVRA